MPVSVPSMQELLSAGVHFGHKVSRGHPKMRPFLFGARDGVHIIDLEKSEERLKAAAQAAFELGRQGKVLLVVGTKKQAREIVKSLAQEVGTPFLTERWIGGLLTNFEEVLKNVNKLASLKQEQEKGELSRYTKKEQLLINRKLNQFEKMFGGVVNLDKLPDAILVIDALAEMVAIREARKVGIVVFGLSDSNTDPNLLDYPIPGNDDGIKSIKLISETVIRSFGQGKKEAGALAERHKRAAMKAEAEEIGQQVAEQVAVLEEEVEKKVT